MYYLIKRLQRLDFVIVPSSLRPPLEAVEKYETAVDMCYPEYTKPALYRMLFTVNRFSRVCMIQWPPDR